MRNPKIPLLAALMLISAQVQATPSCHITYGAAEDAKPNKLYLYFPTASDSTYPEFGTTIGLPATSPTPAFNIANLTSYTGNANDLQNAITDVVIDDYCEFNVHVIQTTTAPPSTYPRRNTVSIGTDDATSSGGLFGLAQNVDIGDNIAVDFAHVWAGTYQGEYGGTGGALNGANSTLQRWAFSIGGTASHEAGHNYGLSHDDGLVLATGEDPLTHHIMASGSHFSGEDRAGYRRHFSDHEYSILAANVGLTVQTVWNWDFINPNSQTANKAVLDILSTQPTLSIGGPYNGSQSPWINPTVSASLGTQVFQGVTYHKYQVTWSTGQNWDGHIPGGVGPSPGVSGQVAGGASFHLGTGFVGVDYNQSNAVVVTNVTLYDSSNNPLAIHPRAAAFNSGAFDAADGKFKIQAFNLARAGLQINNVVVHFLPRMMSIDTMVSNPHSVNINAAALNATVNTPAEIIKPNNRLVNLAHTIRPAIAANNFVDIRGFNFKPWQEPHNIAINKTLLRNQTLSIPIAEVGKRNINQLVTEKDCQNEDRLQGPDVVKCQPGVKLDLFPATSTYLVASATEKGVKHWDYLTKKYVVSNVTSHVHLQFSGNHPDLNKNGVDDGIDTFANELKVIHKITEYPVRLPQ